MEITEERINQITDEMFAQAKAERPATEDGPAPVVDVYQDKQARQRDLRKRSFPNGSSYVVNAVTTAIVDGNGAEGLARAYKRAKDDSDSLRDKGDRSRAELRRQQYMEEYFLPAVEAVINAASPDELLSNKKALEELDGYALVEGSGKGYTAAYTRQAYGNQLGRVEGHSDDSVRSGVRRLNALLDEGQTRLAYGLAETLKKKIDEGRAMAADEDYELICRVKAFYE